ncbi:MAG: 4'-phosphopantetheinyl transferase superfamily protein [Beijerinckiaceae bacterium]
MHIGWFSVHDLEAMAAPPRSRGWARVLAADLRDRRMIQLTELSPLPRDEIDRTRKATGDRTWFAARRSVLRHLVGGIAGCGAQAVDISYDADGAPRVNAPPGLFVSVSGLGPLALLAVGDIPVGVDFEQLARDTAPVPDVLAPLEQARLEKLSVDDARAEFLYIWTAKEAFLKARGRGFLEDPAQFATRFNDGAIAIERNGKTEPASGRLHVVSLDGDFLIAACVTLG